MSQSFCNRNKFYANKLSSFHSLRYMSVQKVVCISAISQLCNAIIIQLYHLKSNIKADKMPTMQPGELQMKFSAKF